ncbi:unnamed protein product, partial [Rotaria sordida]
MDMNGNVDNSMVIFPTHTISDCDVDHQKQLHVSITINNNLNVCMIPGDMKITDKSPEDSSTVVSNKESKSKASDEKDSEGHIYDNKNDNHGNNNGSIEEDHYLCNSIPST